MEIPLLAGQTEGNIHTWTLLWFSFCSLEQVSVLSPAIIPVLLYYIRFILSLYNIRIAADALQLAHLGCPCRTLKKTFTLEVAKFELMSFDQKEVKESEKTPSRLSDPSLTPDTCCNVTATLWEK